MASNKQLHSVIQGKIDKARHELFTGMPAKVLAYDASTQSCTAQPIFQTGEMPMPPVYQVPVSFPCGGGAVMTFPVRAGDLCWLAYSMYPIDEYITGSGDTNAENSMNRTHDMNECIAFVGLGTLKKNYQPDPTDIMIRFGTSKLTIDDAGEFVFTGNLTVNGKIHSTDTIVSDKEITGKDFMSSDLGISFNQHKHHYYWTDPSGDADSETPS